MSRDATVSLALILVLSACLVAAPLPAAAVTESTSLKVSSLVQVVPADGLSHSVIVISLVNQQNKPTVSSATLEVYLSSSNPGVGSVPASVSLPSITGYVIVNFTSTTTAGTTTVSASAQGVNSGSASVKTALLSGYPVALAAFAAPSQTSAQPVSNGTIEVELVDNYGNPAEASTTTVVQLSSSDTRVLNVTSPTVYIYSGEVLTNASYSTSLLTGSATISVSSPGLKDTTVKVTVVGSTPMQLKVQSVSPVTSESQQLTAAVWLEDQNGNPVVAPTDLTISLSSNNFDLLNVEPYVTIFAGSSYAQFTFSTGPMQGSATITAAVTGLESSSFTVTVDRASGLGTDCGVSAALCTTIGLDFLPSKALANGGTYQSVYVYLENESSGLPALVACGSGCPGVQVELTSSNPSVLSVDSSVVIDTGQSYGIANVYAGYLVGTTQITATAFCNCLKADTGDIGTYGQAPASISVQATPQVLPADNLTFADLDVQLVSQSGQPAVAPSNMVLNLSSSDPSVVWVNASVEVSAGQSSALVPVQTSGTPGSATVLVVGSDVASGSAKVTTTVPGASGTKLTFAPQPAIRLASGGMGSLQLVDGNGDPVIARDAVEVTVTASNDSMLPSPIVLTVPAGSDYVTFPLAVQGSGTATFSATSQGLLSSSSQVEVIRAAFRANLGTTTSKLKQGEADNVTVYVTLDGAPVSGAVVNWRASAGMVTPVTEDTGSNGQARAEFVSQTGGSVTVSASVTAPGGEGISTSVSITVASSSNLGFLTSETALVAVAVAVAAVAAADLFYLRRRRGQSRSILTDVKQ